MTVYLFSILMLNPLQLTCNSIGSINVPGWWEVHTIQHTHYADTQRYTVTHTHNQQYTHTHTPGSGSRYSSAGTGGDLSSSHVWAKHQSCAPQASPFCFPLFHSAKIKVLWNTQGSPLTTLPAMGLAQFISSLQKQYCTCKYTLSCLCHAWMLSL